MIRGARLVSSASVPAAFARGLHATNAARIFVRKSGGGDGPKGANNNTFKRGTPKKNAGSIWSYEKTVAHTRLGEKAPEIELSSFADAVAAGKPQAAVYPAEHVQRLSALGAFRRTQNHELFRQRSTVVRPLSVELDKIVDAGKTSSSKDSRLCFIGERGVGKSTALTHTQALAVSKGYVVVAIPRALDLIDGTTDAVYHKPTEQFVQPMYASRFMKRIVKANKEALQTIPVDEALIKGTESFRPHSTAAKQNLLTFLVEGRKRPDAFLVLEEALNILAKQTAVPVLITVDDVNALSSKVFAENRDVDNNQVYVGDLQVPRLVLKYLSGEAELARGVVAAALTNNFALNDTVVCGLGLRQQDAYYTSIFDFDADLAKAFRGVKPVEVPRFTQEETRVAVEYLHAATVLKEDFSDAVVREKYFLSGNGNPGALIAACTMAAV